MKIKILMLSVLFTLCLISLHAAWLNNVPYTIQQPDGSKISCLISGDEFYHRIHDAKDYTIIKNNKTGYFSYAILENNEPQASDHIVGRSDPSQLGLNPGVKESEKKYNQSRKLWLDALSRNPYKAPSTGLLNNLVIFIRFSDEAEFGESVSGYDTMFNNTVPGANSLHNFFEEASYGTLDVNTSFYPDHPNGLVVSYQDSHPRSYYEPYDASSNPGGYADDGDRTVREHALLRDACDFCSAEIPTTLNLDGDNDGQVDNICFTVSGTAGAWADLLWPHMWVLETYMVTINGKRVYTYNFQLQEFLQAEGVGVLCHEMFHSLGSPDLYHYSYSGPSPVGNWDLMEGTQDPPQHMGAYMKYRYVRWIDSIPAITATGTYTLHPLTSATNNCYKIASPNTPDEFYVVEYRDHLGPFESSTPGAGLLIYRIDHTLDGQGNADGPPDEVYVYRPNGTTTANGQISQANYSSLVGRTAINDGTIPSGFLQDGSPGGLNISQISEPDTTISFYVDFSLPPTTYDEGFETGNMTGYPWVLTGNANWGVINGGAFAGLYCAKSGVIGNSQTTSATVSYLVPDDGNIGFYKKVSSQSNHDYLVFFIDNVEKGRWSGTIDWTYTTFPVTEGPHDFKWTYLKNATNVSGSDCAWIDNISFPQEAPPPLLPPTDLTAYHENGNHACLHWMAPEEDLIGYMIYKNGEFLDMVGATDSTLYHDSALLTGLTTYKVSTVYETGESPFSNEVTISPIVGNDDNANVMPSVTGLTSIYPNPFNPETNIAYQLKKQGLLSIDIYNIRGEKTNSLFAGNKAAGNYSVSWYGKDDTGHAVASGIYFVRFTSDGHHDTRKIILLK
jgi:M6 family metalloprotease-like protein